jgi:diguanylate cyclase (GGDEF)-like protein
VGVPESVTPTIADGARHDEWVADALPTPAYSRPMSTRSADLGDGATPSTSTRRRFALLSGPASLVARLRSSEYLVVGATRRFRAIQRRRIVGASRIGYVVIVLGAAFDTVALLGLQTGYSNIALGLSVVTAVSAIVAWWFLPGRLRRRPELVAWIVTMGVAVSTVATGLAVPVLAVQTAGYLLVLPGLVALMLPWRTVIHVRWLLAYAVAAAGYLAVDWTGSFNAQERGDLVVVLLVALGASLAGHILLMRSQIRSFVQLESIRHLRRQSDTDRAALEVAHHALELTARTDPLTGAGNRRRLDEDLRAVRAHISRSGFVYGLMEIDLDRFKAVNDVLGHGAGDDVLQRTVAVIQGGLRAEDALYRLGGEEFLVIVSVPTVEALTAAAERVRTIVVGLGIVHPANPPIGVVSVSIGATLIGRGELGLSDDEWLGAADTALYAAKAGGRNQVRIGAHTDLAATA